MSDPYQDAGPTSTGSSPLPRLGPKAGNLGPLYCKGWDLAVLGGAMMPGQSRILKGGVKLKHDKKPKAGADGARPTFHGTDPQEFDLEVTVWTDQQVAKLVEVCSQILPSASVDAKPLALQHPALRHLGATVNMKVIGIGPLHDAGDIPRGKKVLISMLHWNPPPATGKSATKTDTKATRNVATEKRDAQNPSNPPPQFQSTLYSPNPNVAPSSG